MTRRSRRTLLAVLGAGLVAVALVVPVRLRGLSFVSRVAGIQGAWVERMARWGTTSFEVSEEQVPSRHGPLRARLYRPRDFRGRTVLLTSGVHAAGIDEPRLVRLAEALATSGLGVIALELPDLLRYRITPRLPDMMEDALGWAAARPELAPDKKVGLFGISFSGGLAVVAAGRPAVQERVAFVLSLGGHGELARVLAFLCTGVQPDGERRAPHDYGVVVILLNVAEHLVPPEQAPMLREGILTYLRASHATLVDTAQARALFERARELQAGMPEPASTLMGYVNSRDVAALGPLLLPHVKAFADAPSLSPERSPLPTAPTYLLHGTDDNVIPAIESVLLARHLAPRTEVHLLLTPLITHAEVDRRASLEDLWKLVAFWARLLDA